MINRISITISLITAILFSTSVFALSDVDALLIGGAGHGEMKYVEKALSHGANINAIDDEGNTALIYACLMSQKEIVKLLLQKGCDVNIKNKKNETALMMAEDNVIAYENEKRGKDSIEIINLLKKHGAK